MQLLLLAFGIVAGAELAGLSNVAFWTTWWSTSSAGGRRGSGSSSSVSPPSNYFSEPRGTLSWLLVVLFAAWLGQFASDWLVGTSVSGFFGALVMAPVALAIADLDAGPPSQVTFLLAFWLLVPGALGLIGVTEVVGNPAVAGLEDLVDPLASIALGVLCGALVHHGLAVVPAGCAADRLTRKGRSGPPRPARWWSPRKQRTDGRTR